MTHYILLPVYGHSDLALKALKSVTDTVNRTDVEIYVKWLDKPLPPEGFTKAMNDLLRIPLELDQHYNNIESVTCIASDVEIVTKDWLTKILNFVKDKPDVGLVAPFEYLLNDKCALLPYTGERKELNDPANKPLELVYPIWAMVWMSMPCLRAIGLFDPKFNPGSYEDFDYAVQARIKGFKTMWFPDVVYNHVRGATIGPLVNEGIYQYPTLQAAYFYNKWRDVLTEGQNADDVLDRLVRLKDKNYKEPQYEAVDLNPVLKDLGFYNSVLEKRKKELGLA
jgi:GT2 family glycosyltransferase